MKLLLRHIFTPIIAIALMMPAIPAFGAANERQFMLVLRGTPVATIVIPAAPTTHEQKAERDHS
jgi:hypothetical protein